MATEGGQLDGNRFAKGLLSGIHRVIGEQEVLNRINVFPVADGDTGTNLSLSLGAALPILKSDGDKHLGTLLAHLADALLDGARGNSGAIMAQFFQGLSDSAGQASRFTVETFGKAVQNGSDYAHDALSNPREGTILSVISDFAKTLRSERMRERSDNFAELLSAAREELDRSLERTTEQLDALRKAGVVDAGAKGFVAMIHGFANYLERGSIDEAPSYIDNVESVAAPLEVDGDSRYRFCTECIVTGTNIDRRKLREKLGQLGDSLVLAGTKRKAKIHIHVDNPEEVFDLAATYGDVSGQKADDMHRQQRSSHDTNRQFAVVVDSAADIPDEQLEALDIHIVPLRIQFGERGFLDKVSITPNEFFAELKSNPVHPTTSQPAPGDFRRQFQFLASHYEDVLSINVTEKVSGTYQAAVAAAERVDARGRVHVYDSRSASTGQGMLAVHAARCAEQGKSMDETLKELDALAAQTRTFAILENMHYAVRGGRVPPWGKFVADVLRMRLILKTTPDGKVSPGSFLLGHGNRIERFAKYVAKKTPDEGAMHVAIGHALCADDADKLAAILRERLGHVSSLTVSELGTAIGVHGGPGTIVVSLQPAQLSANA